MAAPFGRWSTSELSESLAFFLEVPSSAASVTFSDFLLMDGLDDVKWWEMEGVAGFGRARILLERLVAIMRGVAWWL